MINTNNILYNIIKKCNSFDTSYVNEIEEVIDYGLEKTEENIQKVALEYLDEKGFARRPDNLNQAKQFVMESSEYSDTVLQSVNQSHNEVMFMYSMLNEKEQKINDMTMALGEIGCGHLLCQLCPDGEDVSRNPCDS